MSKSPLSHYQNTPVMIPIKIGEPVAQAASYDVAALRKSVVCARGQRNGAEPPCQLAQALRPPSLLLYIAQTPMNVLHTLLETSCTAAALMCKPEASSSCKQAAQEASRGPQNYIIKKASPHAHDMAANWLSTAEDDNKSLEQTQRREAPLSIFSHGDALPWTEYSV